jgi:hypothetical protein
MVRVIIVVEDTTVTVKCRTVIQSLFPYLCLGVMLHILACSSISFLIHLEVVASTLPQINAGFCSFSVNSSHLLTKSWYEAHSHIALTENFCFISYAGAAVMLLHMESSKFSFLCSVLHIMVIPFVLFCLISPLVSSNFVTVHLIINK